MEIVNCPVCKEAGNPDSEVYSDFSNQIFFILRCKNCGLGWIKNPNQDFFTLYNEQYYKGEGGDKDVAYYHESFGEQDDFQVKIRLLEYKGIAHTLLKLEESSSSRKHLDFGGGLGGLVRYLNENGFESELAENEYPRKVAEELKTPTALDLKENYYDYVTAIELLEHLVEPLDTLNEICAAIKPGGYLIVTTGNLARHRGPIARWSYVKNNPDVHVTFFTPQALSLALAEFGLKKENVKFQKDLILFKILKNLGFYALRKNRKYLLKYIYHLRFIFYPVLPIVDWTKGVSAMGVYKK